MSLILPTSSPIQPLAQARDPAGVAVSPAMRPTQAVSATLTQTAIQQTRASTRPEMLLSRDTVPITDKRNRLVGPPPAFQVNVLQHIRETRAEPPDLRPETQDHAQDLSAPEMREDGKDDSGPAVLAEKSGFAPYRQLAPMPEADESTATVDTRL